LFVSQGRTHTILGTVVVAAMAFQPVMGLLHHRHFVQNQGRGAVSHFHIWWGRLLMVLGIINGGLGLQLALASKSVMIGYSVAAAVLFLAYVAAKVVGSCILVPARNKKSLRGNRGGPEPDMAYRPEGDYQQPPPQQNDRQYKGPSTAGNDSSAYYSNGSSVNNNGASVSPSLPPARAQRPNAATRPYEEDSGRQHNRMRREEQRYA
jgi:hypothetical protein